MKKLSILACSLLILSACKNEKTTVVPDTTTEKPADTLKKDTVAAVVPPMEEVENASETPASVTTKTVTTTESAKPVAEIKTVQADPKGKDIKVAYASFGSKILADKALTKDEMMAKYATLKKGDTVAVKFKSTIKDVCKKKGCWMKMELPNSKEAFVRFKDYGFFVPLNADKSDAIVSGKAFLDVISVDELKHYAKDGGKSQEEIDKITAPKVTYAFTADGVLIQE